jgi:predicted DNA-binding transcriptional regulator AlpA
MAGEPRNRAERRHPDVMRAAEVAAAWGCSEWLVYKMAREGSCPVPPIHLGRKLVWSRVAVDRLLAGAATEA